MQRRPREALTHFVARFVLPAALAFGALLDYRAFGGRPAGGRPGRRLSPTGFY